MIYKQVDKGYLIRLMKDEEIITQLIEFVKAKNIASASLVGIGAINCVKLGYYDVATKSYYVQDFMDNFELLNLTGNIAYYDGEPMPHCHVTIADHNLKVAGGHLEHAKVSVTVEIFLTELDTKIERIFDDATALKLLDL